MAGEVVVHGTLKYASQTLGNKAWVSGIIKAQEDGNHWKISVCTVARPDKPLFIIPLKKGYVTRFTTKNQLIIHTKNCVQVQVKNLKEHQLKQLQNLWEEAAVSTPVKQPMAPTQTQPKSSPMNRINMASPHFNKSLVGTPVSQKIKQSPSPVQYTSMKSSTKKSRDEKVIRGHSDTYCANVADLKMTKDDFKENTESPVPAKKSALSFLEKGVEKSKEMSREALTNLTPVGFYSNKDASASGTRFYGQFSTHSSVNRGPRRRTYSVPRPPGLLHLEDKSNVKYSWAKTPSLKSSQTTLQGFSNLGNTCYMNAILQALFGLESFTWDLLVASRRYAKAVPDNSLVHSMGELCRARCNKNNTSAEQNTRLLKNLKKAISSTARRFSGNEENDAHEFLNQLLDQLKEELLKITKGTPSPDRNKENDDMVLGQDNPTMQNFEFEVLHRIKCLDCEEEVTKAEQFNDLSLELTKNRDMSSTSIQDALDHFFCEEKLEYTCEKCQSKAAEVSHEFTRLPRVLVLHMKRYNYSSKSSISLKKAQELCIPRFLTLNAHCTEETQPALPPVLPRIRSLVEGTDYAKCTDAPKRKLDFHRSTEKRNFKFTKTLGGSPLRGESRNGITESDHMDADMAKALKESHQELEREKRQKETEERLLTEAIKSSEKEVLVVAPQDVKEESGSSHEASSQNQLFGVEEFTLNMTEEEQLRLAMEQSLLDTNLPPNAGEQGEQKMECISTNNHTQQTLRTSSNKVDSGVDLYAGYCDPNKSHCEYEWDSILKDSMTVASSDTPMDATTSTETSQDSDRIEHTVVKPSPAKTDQAFTSTNSQWTSTSAKTEGINGDFTSSVETDLEESVVSNGGKRKSGERHFSDSVTANGSCDPMETEGDSPSAQKKPKFDSSFSEENLKLELEGDEFKDTSQSDLENPKLSDDPENPNFSDDPENPKLSDDPENPKLSDDLEDPKLSDDLENPKLSEDRKSDSQIQEVFETQDDDVVIMKTEPAINSTGTAVSESPAQPADISNVDTLIDLAGDNKENTTPPKANQTSETDWGRSRADQEDNDLQLAMQNSLKDQEVLGDFDEQLRRAKELSLQEFNQIPAALEDHQPVLTVERSESEKKKLRRNAEFGDLPYSYRLVSVVNHLGSSSASGHYVSDVYNIKTKQWKEYDDLSVMNTTEQNVLSRRQKTGYIFFYINKDVLEDLQEKNHFSNIAMSPVNRGPYPARPVSR